jgi:PAS domain S-box-containing protein
MLGVSGKSIAMSDEFDILPPEQRLAVLEDRERKYRAIFEKVDIGIFHLEPDGRWTDANPAAARILGYDAPKDLLSDQPDLAGRLFINAASRDAWLNSLRTENRHSFETAVRTHDGRVIWVSFGGHESANGDGADCTLYDVTERRNAENDLIRAKEQADFANRSKSEFLANMSHELRTPLNAIIGFAEIIKDQMFGPVGQMQYVEYSKDIYDSGQLLLSLINDILYMSKIEAGKRALKDVTLDVDTLAASVVRLVAARAKEGKVRLSVHIPRDIPALRGEEKAVKQILTNLLTNAVKFTPEGGSVTLSAMVDDERRLTIKVIDSGIGIAKADIAIALTPFGQIESALSRKHQGDRKSTRLNSSHRLTSRMPSSA